VRPLDENERMPLPRIMFDTNDGSMEHGYRLGFDRSRKALEALGEALREGATVIIYMPDELEMKASLRFDRAENVWWADPLDGVITFLDGAA